MPNVPWAEVTREERLFTCILYNDITQDPRPIWNMIRGDLDCSTDVTVVDQGYEVCFFRDAYHAEPKLIQKRQSALEKQTFDLVLSLSNDELVVIECKAQQAFHVKQLNMLKKAQTIMTQLSNPGYRMRKIHLVALCSSKYKPSPTTLGYFDTIIRWNAVANAYPLNGRIYRRADYIYGD